MRAILKISAIALKIIGFIAVVFISAAVWLAPRTTPPAAAHVVAANGSEEGRAANTPGAVPSPMTPRLICHFREKRSAEQIEKSLQACGVVIVFEDAYRKAVYRKADALMPELNKDARYIAVLREAEEEEAQIKATERETGFDDVRPYEAGRDYNSRARRRHGATGTRARRR